MCRLACNKDIGGKWSVVCCMKMYCLMQLMVPASFSSRAGMKSCPILTWFDNEWDLSAAKKWRTHFLLCLSSVDQDLSTELKMLFQVEIGQVVNQGIRKGYIEKDSSSHHFLDKGLGAFISKCKTFQPTLVHSRKLSHIPNHGLETKILQPHQSSQLFRNNTHEGWRVGDQGVRLPTTNNGTWIRSSVWLGFILSILEKKLEGMRQHKNFKILLTTLEFKPTASNGNSFSLKEQVYFDAWPTVWDYLMFYCYFPIQI